MVLQYKQGKFDEAEHKPNARRRYLRQACIPKVAILIFSRGHATLHLAVSVGRSVDR